MLKPVVMSLVLSGLGPTAVGANAADSDIATWRWRVSALLEAQHADPSPLTMLGALDARDFGQQYERYSASGAPDARWGAT